MIAYGIGVLPLIQELRDAHPYITQPWYADDAGAGGKFGEIIAHFGDLKVRGSPQGYFPDSTNSMLVVSPRKLTRDEEFFQGRGLKVVTGSHYLGGSLATGRQRQPGWTRRCKVG